MTEDHAPQHPPQHAPTVRLLVGMSVREAVAHERLSAIAAGIDADVAYLQLGDPTLTAALTRHADAGAGRILVLGASLGALAPANSWLRRIAGHWWRLREEAERPVVEVATALLRHESDLDLGVFDVTREIHGREAPLTSAAWEDVPRHRHHVLVCRGPRCAARGSDRTAEQLARTLNARGLGDDDVLVTQTGCLFPCNHAPVVCVQPDDVWYGAVSARDVDELVTSHRERHTPLERLRLPRDSR